MTYGCAGTTRTGTGRRDRYHSRGRTTGQPRRIEIRFHHIAGQVYIAGRPPRRRDWYANLLAHPEFTFHLKQGLQADVPARATPILDEARRRAIIAAIHE